MRIIAALARFCLSVLAISNCCFAVVLNDLWDSSNGTIIINSSGQSFDGLGNPNGNLLNMFGTNLNVPLTGELGTAFFRDDQPAGFTHFVEWRTTAPVLVDGFNLYTVDDADMASGDRGFTEFRLFYLDASSSFVRIASFRPPANPYPNHVINRTQRFTQIVAQTFRAEFDQFSSRATHDPGVRVIELDALTPTASTIPEPTSMSIFAVLSLGGLTLSRRSRVYSDLNYQLTTNPNTA